MSEAILFNMPNPVFKPRYPQGALYWEGEEFVDKTGGWNNAIKPSAGTNVLLKYPTYLQAQDSTDQSNIL